MRTQILMIHGGMTFKSKKDYINHLRTRTISLDKYYSWTKDYMDKLLGKKYEIIRPRMPLQDNAKYAEWKIHFERYLPLLKNNVILIGSSLGGIFLAKYLSENKFPKKIKALLLVCPPYDNTISGEDLVGGFKLKKDLSMIDNCSKSVHLFFSENDPVVPPSQTEKYKKKLKKANIHIYKHIPGHFQISKFPEIINIIKKL
ncbi:alpha/beta hydrolase [Candidatus Woesearchaeota archaeon]|nr:alpha/beta hydrolase [Candidatus Woesearchaeota archaeon]